MGNELKSARGKVTRARELFQEFDGRARPWRDSKPHKRIVTVDPATGQQVHPMRLEKPMPEGLDDIAADIFHNLRSALDQAGHAVAVANNQPGNAAYYPFGDTAVEVASRRTGASKEIPSEIFNVMESFKPYKGGNDLLWALNKMRNRGEHRITCAVGKAGNHSIFFFQRHGPIETGMVVPMPPVVWSRVRKRWSFCESGAAVMIDIDQRLPRSSRSTNSMRLRGKWSRRS